MCGYEFRTRKKLDQYDAGDKPADMGSKGTATHTASKTCQAACKLDEEPMPQHDPRGKVPQPLSILTPSLDYRYRE